MSIMTRSRSRKRQNPGSEPATWWMLPDEMAIEILSRLPGKQIGRCKCVSKSWLSLIDSPSFSDACRSRQRCLMLYWAERIIPQPTEKGTTRLRFYYSPLSHRRPEEFRRLLDLSVKSNDAVTQLVNGVICVAKRERGFRLSSGVVEMTVYNVCTKEAMVVPQPKAYANTVSTFHLGYNPASGTYKLLRVIFHLGNQGAFHGPPRAKIMTLRPSSADSIWRNLKFDEAGIRNLSAMRTSLIYYAVKFNEARTFSGDGALCWFCLRGEGLISFDLSEERFRVVKLPPEVRNEKGQIVPRAAFKGLSLWIVPGEEWYVLEDDEGEKWSRHRVQLPEEVRDCAGLVGGLGVANGSHSSSASASTGGEVMLMNRLDSESMAVYSYGRHTKTKRFLVGKLPEKKPLDPRCRCNVSSRESYLGFDARLSCLLDSNHLYLPLEKVLNGHPPSA